MKVRDPLDRDFWRVMGADFMISITVFGVQTAVLNLFLLRLGYEVPAVGRLNSIGVLMYAACAIAVGAGGGLPFRLRPRTALILGSLLGQSSNLLIPIALFIPPSARTPFILATLLIRSLGLGLYTVALQPYLMSTSTPSSQGRAFSFWAASGMSGGLVGSLSGGYLSAAAANLLRLTQQQAEPFALTLIVIGVATLPAPLLISRTSNTNRQPRKTSVHATISSSKPIPVLTIFVMFLIMGLRVTPSAVMHTYGSVFLDQVQGASSQVIGTGWSVSMAFAIPLVLMSSRMVRRFGSDRTLFMSLTGVSLIMLPIIIFDSRLGSFITLIGFNGLTHMARTAFLLTSMRSVPERWRTTMAGATESAAALSFVASGFVGGPAIAAWGYDPVFAAVSVSCVLAIVLYQICRRISPSPAQ